MKCPICEATLRPGADRCHDCGYRVPQNAAAEPASAPRTAPVKNNKKTGCCCCLAVLLPFLVFLIIAIISVAQFVMEEIEFILPEFGIMEEEPVDEPSVQAPDLIPESIPAPADDSCFVLVENTLMFVPENWDGSPILNVPEYVGGEQVTNIGPGCFQDCDMLTTILLPESVTAISPLAFSGCSKLRGLYIPDGVGSIGQDAFAGCIDLEAVYIPVSVTRIAEHAFDDCASLRFIFYGGNFEDWNALYDDYVNPFTTAVCLDGYFYHGSEG